MAPSLWRRKSLQRDPLIFGKTAASDIPPGSNDAHRTVGRVLSRSRKAEGSRRHIAPASVDGALVQVVTQSVAAVEPAELIG